LKLATEAIQMYKTLISWMPRLILLIGLRKLSRSIKLSGSNFNFSTMPSQTLLHETYITSHCISQNCHKSITSHSLHVAKESHMKEEVENGEKCHMLVERCLLLGVFKYYAILKGRVEKSVTWTFLPKTMALMHIQYN